MAAEEDNFEIDIYGEGEAAEAHDEADYYEDDEHTFTIEEPQPDPPPIPRSDSERTVSGPNASTESTPSAPRNMDGSNHSPSVTSQGVKRKGSPNERAVDSGATTALMLSDLHWWITEDDIRGWVNQARAEDGLKEITFSEHKVNGKSKG
jgi:hypothetical protein